eukprot:12910419-Alexandrium_andersonii.AAC.1
MPFGNVTTPNVGRCRIPLIVVDPPTADGSIPSAGKALGDWPDIPDAPGFHEPNPLSGLQQQAREARLPP